MEGQGQAITKRPPHGSDTEHPRRVAVVAVSPVSTAAALVVPGKVNNNVGDWVTFQASADCFIRFGDSPSMGPATSSDWPIKADVEYSWWIRPDDAYFRIVSAGVGSLKRYTSS